MSIFSRLLTASTAMHAAEQITLAAIPLIAAAAGADARDIGLLVAAQSSAWLVVSLPAGALADRLSRRTLLIAGAILAIVGYAAGFGALRAANSSLLLLGVACFATAAGMVVIVLSVFAVLPLTVPATALPRANARLELARAIVTCSAPAPAAWLVARGHGDLIFALAGIFGVMALIAGLSLPRDATSSAPATPMLAAIRDGARFVARHPALRAIALCAICWNMAFFAMTALFVPYATTRLGLDAAGIGRAWSATGAGLVASAWFAPAITKRASLSSLLIFGPLVSAIAIMMIVVAGPIGGEPLLWIAFFLIGFGPMLWAVTQTSLRQQITPTEMMGRVGATMQAANYGARPIGALIAGWLAVEIGVANAMWLPALLFTASLASMAWLLRSALSAAQPSAA